MKVIKTCMMLISFILIFPILATSDNSSDVGSLQSNFDENFRNIAKRLNLTEKQIEETKPVFFSSFNERIGIFQKYGFNPETGKKPGLMQLRKMKKELKDLEMDTDKQLSSILSQKQMDELATIRKEEEEKIKKQMEENDK